MQRQRARPDPVSCQSCRSKKLRCNRVQPCSNCSARGIACTFLVPPQRQQNGSSATTSSNSELLQRIERLESLLQFRPGLRDDNLHIPTPNSDISYADSYQGHDSELQLLQDVGARQDSLVCQTGMCYARQGTSLTCSSCHLLRRTLLSTSVEIGRAHV